MTGGKLTENYRPVQDLKGREILYNDLTMSPQEPHAAAGHEKESGPTTNKSEFAAPTMPTTSADATKGMDKGMEKSMEKGMDKGMEKGMEKGMDKGMNKGTDKGTDEHGMKQSASSHIPSLLVTLLAAWVAWRCA